MTETRNSGANEISRRGVLVGAGGASLAALFAQFGIAYPAFAAGLGDPWFANIKTYNWDWMGHRDNGKLGGQDYAFAYGDPIYAPAPGTLGSGSGGNLRFTLETSAARLVPAEDGESGDTMVALGFMHLSDYGSPGYYNTGDGPIAWVGNTNVQSAHLHVHGIAAGGGRVDWRKFVDGPYSNPQTQTEDDEDMPYLLYNASSQHADRRAYYTPGSPLKVITTAQALVAVGLMKQYKRVSSTTPDAQVTTNVTDQMWDFLVSMEGSV